MELIAWILSLLLLVQIIFQTMLASGAPYGHISYGGKHTGKLPNNYRIASAVSVLFYLFFLSVSLSYASEIIAYSEAFSRNVLWTMAAFFSLGTIANVASPSKPERYWALYTIASLICIIYLLGIF